MSKRKVAPALRRKFGGRPLNIDGKVVKSAYNDARAELRALLRVAKAAKKVGAVCECKRTPGTCGWMSDLRYALDALDKVSGGGR